MLTKEYWEARVKANGHTGYADPFLYCFDQEARKFAIDIVLTKAGLKNCNNALDFGCGTGDFFEVLLKHAHNLTGYDISTRAIEMAKRRVQDNDRVILISDRPSVTPFDLVLSVTVFQKLTLDELRDNLGAIRANMVSGAHMVCMEFFATKEMNAASSEQDVTVADWMQMLRHYGLKQIDIYDFYNPVLFPTESWVLYRDSILLKLLKLFKHSRWVQRLWSSKARSIIYARKDVLATPNDIFKIYLLQKL